MCHKCSEIITQHSQAQPPFKKFSEYVGNRGHRAAGQLHNTRRAAVRAEQHREHDVAEQSQQNGGGQPPFQHHREPR